MTNELILSNEELSVLYRNVKTALEKDLRRRNSRYHKKFWRDEIRKEIKLLRKIMQAVRESI